MTQIKLAQQGAITPAMLASGGFGSATGQALFPESAGALSSLALGSGKVYYLQIDIPWPRTITGVIYWVGSTADATNCMSAGLANAAGTLVANSSLSPFTPQPSANSKHQLAFTAPYVAAAGTYFVELGTSSSTATAQAAAGVLAEQGNVLNFGQVLTITPPGFPSPLAAFPLIGLY